MSEQSLVSNRCDSAGRLLCLPVLGVWLLGTGITVPRRILLQVLATKIEEVSEKLISHSIDTSG